LRILRRERREALPEAVESGEVAHAEQVRVDEVLARERVVPDPLPLLPRERRELPRRLLVRPRHTRLHELLMEEEEDRLTLRERASRRGEADEREREATHGASSSGHDAGTGISFLSSADFTRREIE